MIMPSRQHCVNWQNTQRPRLAVETVCRRTRPPQDAVCTIHSTALSTLLPYTRPERLHRADVEDPEPVLDSNPSCQRAHTLFHSSSPFTITTHIILHFYILNHTHNCCGNTNWVQSDHKTPVQSTCDVSRTRLFGGR